MDTGTFGVWWSGRWRIGDESFDAAAELESLGYSALWSSGGFDQGFPRHFQRLLHATNHVTVASGIINIWKVPPGELSSAVALLNEQYPNRFLTGIGVSHAPRVETYARPYSAMVSYLDRLDLESPPIPRNKRILAALAPKMLALASQRSLGSHPYLVPVEYIGDARSVMGSGALLAPAVMVALESDPLKARDLARAFLSHYLTLPNYTNNLRSLGFREEEMSGGGGDRLVDSLVCWGTLETVAAKILGYLEAGADHVCVNVLPNERDQFPLREYRELASALLSK